MKKIRCQLFQIAKAITFVTLLPAITFFILNLLNSYFWGHRLGEWLPFWSSLTIRIVGFSFILALLLTISDRDEKESEKNSP